MRQKNLPHFQVVKRHEKASRIEALVTRYIDRVAGSLSRDAMAEVLILARSFESPVVREMARAADELQRNRISVRLIVADAGSEVAQNWVSTDGPLTFSREIRALRDKRVLDAHEQMILGKDTAWTGDCMRRDPLRQDSFESLSIASAETTRTARLCFERIWEQSPRLVAIAAAESTDHDDARSTNSSAEPPLAPASDSETRVAGTRH